MANFDELLEKIGRLESLAKDIESNTRKMYNSTRINYTTEDIGNLPYRRYRWEKPNDNGWVELQRDVTKKYQEWYSTASQYIKVYAPDRLLEFTRFYGEKTGSFHGIIEALKLSITPNNGDRDSIVDSYMSWFYRQRDILNSIPSIVEAQGSCIRTENPIDLVCEICERFHFIVRQFRDRGRDRSPLDIGDEYDVQYLFHALLYLHFTDIRTEEWTPSYAGSSARMDFLLKSEQIVIETKMTRDGLNAKALGNELIEDIARYKAHPDCKVLICFVYDPRGLIANPRGVENDLNKQDEGLQVRVFIRP